MGRPLESKIPTTIKPRIPEELMQAYFQEFEVFKKDMESLGLNVNQGDFLNYVIVKFIKDKKESKDASKRDNTQ